jgi:hypothetical protein
VKRNDLIRHLTKHGCAPLREGSRHSFFVHLISHQISTIPRHNEIDDFLAKKIRKDLGIPLE